MAKTKTPPRFRGTVENDNGRPRIAIGNPARYHDYLRSLKEGAHVWITIETEENKRTLSQNAYYWVYLNIIAEETGDDPNSLHEFFKRRFLPPVELRVLKREIKVPSSTTELNKGEFSEYLNRISAETGVPLPDPEDAGYISNH